MKIDRDGIEHYKRTGEYPSGWSAAEFREVISVLAIEGISALTECAAPEVGEFALPCELVVGAGRFGKGVGVSTAQGAIDRLYERMRLMESRLGELCYSCKLGIFHLDKSHQINLAPDAASGGTVVWVHDDCEKSAAKSFFPKRETIPSPLAEKPRG